ncbi:MAG: PAS domain-containing protein [Desulfobacterales bacterium]
MQNPAKSTLTLSTQNFIWIGIGLGLLYWFLESWIHVIFFQEGTLVSQILNPDLHETWKRVLVITLLICFSIYGQYSISMRRRAEAAVKERERELSQILENNPAGIMLVDSSNRTISWANTNALKMVGSTKNVVEGNICHTHLCPADEGNCPVLDNGQSIDMSERILLTAEGENLPILKSVTRVKYEGKDHLLETFFDLSDRKKMEKDLELAHAELDQIFQTASVGMRLVDRDFKVLKINRTFATMTGVNEADAIGRKCHEVFAGSMCATPECPLTLILTGKEAVDCYVDKQRTDGISIPCILTATPFTGPDGGVVGIVESFQDITDLKQAQEAIRSERDKLHRILSHLMEGVCIVNPDYTIEYQNAILKKYLGECEGKACYKSFRQTESPCEPCLMRTAIENGEVQQHEFETTDGRSFEQAYTPVTDVDEKQKVVVLLRDVTEQKASTTAMMRAEQLAALGEMAAGVAHEINNPINGIINYAQILVNKSSANSFAHDLGERMIREGDRIARIVEGLLSFARRKKEEKTLVAVEDILSDSLALTDAQMRKDNIIVNKNMAKDLPRILAQAHEIEQVFVNIISNARYALNQRYPQPDEDKVLEIITETHIVKRRPYVRISFRDHGSGISAGIIEKVRNPFFSTKTEGKRTGLGLSISHGIINDHGGQLKIDSVEGKYTRVSVELPVGKARNS